MAQQPTIAEVIAKQFENDGNVYEDKNGATLDDVCEAKCVNSNSDSGDLTRYEFTDQSAIVTTGGPWDIGYPGSNRPCFCWKTWEGHHENCEGERTEVDS